MNIQADTLERAVRAIFRAAGSQPRECELAARHLVEANLRGHDSHGVGMLPGYMAAIRAGDLRLNAILKVDRDDGHLLVCDGGQGVGQVMAHDAMRLGIERATANGTTIVALRDSYHIGRIGHWAEQCAEAGLVSIHFVNVPAHAAVAPFLGGQARLGTNPFAAGFPRSGGVPIIVDFATSRWAVGKVRVAWKKGEQAPPGYLLDAKGEPTTDPATIFSTPAGALLPFGEHKGYGLALACELLAGALLGGFTQTGAPSKRITNSMLSVILSPDALGGRAAFESRLESLAGWVTSEKLTGRRVLLPGDPERERRATNLRDGIHIDESTWDEICAAAKSVGVDDRTLVDQP
ncbi:MAG: malate/lactate/ureidoglycolate dehydrogenase [Alphaproteobacteria bacterium]|nr:malate/lactate/ureidoglycolate dehydrogenase [Alphaproteobacteria bacterium]